MNNLVKILINPREAYLSLKEDCGMALPIIAVLVFVVISTIFVSSNMDLEAMMQENREAMQASDMPDAQLAMHEEQLIGVSPVVLIAGTVVSASLFYLLILLVHALYLKIVSSITKDGIEFSDWMGFVSWSRIPVIIGSVVIVVVTALSDNVTQESVSVLSLSHYWQTPNIWFGVVLAFLDLPLLWSLIIMTIGYSAWTEKSIGTSIGIVFGPFIVILALAWILG